MVKGRGTDIVEIERVRKSIERHGNHFLNRLFTLKEQDYCLKFKDPVPHLAGRFSAKEAVVKALGVGFGANISWHDIEILDGDKGQPHVYFSDAINSHFQNPRVLISISHSTDNATAVAIWIK